MTAKAEWFDTPDPHPLAFFTRYPILLDEGGDFCHLCTPQKRLGAAISAKDPRAETHFVGVIKGLRIYDVFYRFHSEVTVDWKSILVKTGPDRYRQIYHRQPTQVDGRAWPSAIESFGPDSLLVAWYSIGGMHSLSAVDYYWFGKSGPILVDVKPIRTAARTALPEGQELWDGDNGFKPQPTSPMKDQFGLCCGGKGYIEVTYTLIDGRVVVSEVHYHQ